MRDGADAELEIRAKMLVGCEAVVQQEKGTGVGTGCGKRVYGGRILKGMRLYDIVRGWKN